MRLRIFVLSIYIGVALMTSAVSARAENVIQTPPSDTTVIPQILALPLSTYIGKPVDSLFNVLPANFTDRGFMPVGIGYCLGVTQGYGTNATNNCFVAIFIDNFTHLPLPNRSKTRYWNMNLARQEIISFIKVYKNNVCVYGCGNPQYD